MSTERSETRVDEEMANILRRVEGIKNRFVGIANKEQELAMERATLEAELRAIMDGSEDASQNAKVVLQDHV